MYFACWWRMPSWSFLSLLPLAICLHQAKSSTLKQRGMERFPPCVARPYRITLHMWYGGSSCVKCRLSWHPATRQVTLHCPRLRVHCQVGQCFVLAERWRRERSWGKMVEAERGESRLSSAQPGDRWFWGQSHGQAQTPIISRCQDSSSGELWTCQKRYIRPYYSLLQT